MISESIMNKRRKVLSKLKGGCDKEWSKEIVSEIMQWGHERNETAALLSDGVLKDMDQGWEEAPAISPNACLSFSDIHRTWVK